MSMLWLTPAALLGTLLIAIPIAIHLLVRQQSRRVEYPSLRFVQPSALAAFRRRTVQDAPLLTCRAAILIAAVMALAGPVLQTASRSAGQGQRLARAVILAPGTEPSAAATVAGNAFVSRTFTRADLGDAVADASRWLGEQPPSSREVVFAGSLRRGSLTAGDLQALPSTTGIRFTATGTAPGARDLVMPVLGSEAGGLVFEQRAVRLEDDETKVSAGTVTPAPVDAVRIVADPSDQVLADAALRVALGAGLRWSQPSMRVLIAWEGADEAAVRQRSIGATTVRMPRPADAATAASAIVAAVEQVTAAPISGLEPVRISDEQLQAWSRAPGGVPADAQPQDEGDRRWFWAFALALLVLEHYLRRAASDQRAVDSVAEARVA